MKNKYIEDYIFIPKNIIFKINNNIILIKGNLGFLEYKINKFINIKIIDNKLLIESKKEYINSRINIKSLFMTTISILNNMIIGVTNGYIKNLVLFGIGYKAEIENDFIKLFLGFSHLIKYKIPNNIKIICSNNVNISIYGINKQLVGQTAAEIRKLKVPDPYKGKGIRYYNEKLYFKESKKIK